MINPNLYDTVMALLNAHKSKILNYGQLAMSEYHFKTYRAMVLDELGKNGLEKELNELLNEGNHPVRERNGQE